MAVSRRHALGLLIAGLALLATPAWAQVPRISPADGFGLHDERQAGIFTIQRWVSSAEPEVSPAGMCQCIIVVYHGDRVVLTVGERDTLAARTVTELTGQDVNGDGSPDIVISDWSGGAHCCFTTSVYSVGEEVRPVLSLSTGNCSGDFEDLDGDGIREFMTCDDSWAYAYCSFADSPMPRVIYAYDRNRGAYVPATPRFAARYRDELAAALDEAQTWMLRSRGADPGIDKCRLLRAALGLMYAGRVDDGVVLIRSLYRGADRDQFASETVDRVRKSPHWIGR